MTHSSWKRACGVAMILLGSLLQACGGLGAGSGSTSITVTGPNAVSYWNEIATNTVNVPATASGTPQEQRPSTSIDLAAVHLAIYDALMAITGTHQTFAIASSAGAPASNASQPAAVGAAAYGVLKGLFPARTAQYQSAYDSFVAGLPDTPGRQAGLQIGAEAARGILALRANDGRSVALPPYAPGNGPGQFRGVNPIARFLPSVKPFALTSASQFRVPPPPALDSTAYARDFDETRALGGTVSAARTDAQLEIGRFHTEPPPRFWPRNLRNFIMTDRPLADHARLMAMLMVAQADTEIACFESKYFYQFWRPQSAIPLAATDGNDATAPDAAWTPVVPTPNHPEYPAAHACVASALTETMKAFYGTERIAFSFDSTVTNTTHRFDSTSALVEEIRGARIYGGMHFRNSSVRGEELGAKVARQVTQNHFKAR